MAGNLIGELNKLTGQVNYTAYNMKDTDILLGNPMSPVVGWNFFWAKHSMPQRRLVKSMNATGIFVSNLNVAGVIEIGILSGTASNAQIQMMQLTGIPYPIAAVDTKSAGTSFIMATSCQLVGTPEWRRAKYPGITVYTFETPRLVISQGLRVTE